MSLSLSHTLFLSLSLCLSFRHTRIQKHLIVLMHSLNGEMPGQKTLRDMTNDFLGFILLLTIPSTQFLEVKDLSQSCEIFLLRFVLTSNKILFNYNKKRSFSTMYFKQVHAKYLT
jgi:hypothetical protein